jgi:hypothetical protein
MTKTNFKRKVKDFRNAKFSFYVKVGTHSRYVYTNVRNSALIAVGNFVKVFKLSNDYEVLIQNTKIFTPKL